MLFCGEEYTYTFSEALKKYETKYDRMKIGGFYTFQKYFSSEDKTRV